MSEIVELFLIASGGGAAWLVMVCLLTNGPESHMAVDHIRPPGYAAMVRMRDAPKVNRAPKISSVEEVAFLAGQEFARIEKETYSH